MITQTDIDTLTQAILRASSPTKAADMFIQHVDVRVLTEEEALHGIDCIAQQLLEADGGTTRSAQFESLAQIRCYHAWGLQ